MHLIKKNKLLLFLLFIGSFLRFYNFNWGAPFYFHPDERNVVDLVLRSSLTNPSTLLKGTFAYGNFPVILTLILKPLFLPIFQIFKVVDPFSQIVIILRFIEAAASVLTLYFIYLSGKLFSRQVAYLSLAISVFSTGFIQSAHFGTFDGLITLFSVCIFYYVFMYEKSRNVLFFYSSIIMITAGAAAKINLLILAIFPFFILLSKIKKSKKYLPHILKHSLIGGLIIVVLTMLLSPNYISPDFWQALIYERNLVTGQIPVFYTQSFFGTTPVIFQFLHILPFLINPVLTIIFVPSFFYLFYIGIKTKNILYLLLTTFYLILFIPQAFLFAKWTRYMMPTLSFIYLISAIAISDFLKISFKNKQVFSIRYLVLGIIVVINTLFGISYFVTAFTKPDARISASDFAKANIPKTASILSEPYDLGLIPFNIFPNTQIVNFYELETDPSIQKQLPQDLSRTKYIILPSQRLLRSRLLNSQKFPKGDAIYSLLINEAVGFKKIYETPCDIFCKITYLNNPIFGFEETATVFDHPTVMIFKKI